MLGSLYLTACAWRGPQPAVAQPGFEPSEAIVAMDRAASKRVAVAEYGATPQSDGHLEVRFTLANLADEATRVRVDIEIQGPEAAIETVWRVVPLAAGASETVVVSSHAIGATSYEVNLWADED